MAIKDEFDASSSKPEPNELIEAVQIANEYLVKELLKKGADVNARMPDAPETGTALNCAASYGHVEIVRALIHKGARLEEKDGQENTPLISAAQVPSLEIVQLLLEKGANPNAKNEDGNTALILAGTNKDVVELLIKYGADLDAKNNEGLTALMTVATTYDGAEIARVLIDNGADLDAKNEQGQTALDLAFENEANTGIESTEISQLITEAREIRIRMAEEKARAEAAAEAERLHTLATMKQQHLKAQAQKLKPRLG